MTEKTREAYEALEKYGSQREAAAALGISRKSLRDRLNRGRTATVSDKKDEPRPKSQSPVLVKTLEDFRNTYDKDVIIPAKIREGIAALSGGWAYEQEFVRFAGVSYNDLGIYRDMFADYVVIIKRGERRAWAATPELAEEMRKML